MVPALALAALTALLRLPAAAQDAPRDCHVDSYEEWLGPSGTRLSVLPWRHDVPLETARRAWADHFAYQSSIGAVIQLFPTEFRTASPTTDRCADFQARWLDEAREYGDFVIRLPAGPSEFIIFHAGTPPGWAERLALGYYNSYTPAVAPSDVEEIVAAVREAMASASTAATPASVVAAQPGIPVLDYEAWKHAARPPIYAADPFYGIEAYAFGPRGFYGLWDHDAPLEEREAEVAAWWATQPEAFVSHTHPRYFAFLSPDTPERPGGPTYQSTYASFERRFLAEAEAGGDTVLTFLRPAWDGSTVPVYAVFAAGTPPVRIAMILTSHLRRTTQFGFSNAEAEVFVVEYARSAGLPTDIAAMRLYYSGSPRFEPTEVTYEEWLHGMPFEPSGYRGSNVWWHDEPLAERLGRALLAWGEPDEYAVADRWFPGIFLSLGNGDRYDAYQARWLAESIAAGDIVVPFVPLSDVPAGDTAPRPINFAVFWVGSPQAQVEMVLRTWLAERFWMTTDMIDAVVSTYRSMMGFAPLPAGPDQLPG
ncbi:MAG: hypothetical protein IT534_13265 [Bauldia sp.]|nr:hypothetical protein [Bauldia sp.]